MNGTLFAASLVVATVCAVAFMFCSSILIAIDYDPGKRKQIHTYGDLIVAFIIAVHPIAYLKRWLVSPLDGHSGRLEMCDYCHRPLTTVNDYCYHNERHDKAVVRMLTR